jgi:hypothetical protein
MNFDMFFGTRFESGHNTHNPLDRNPHTLPHPPKPPFNQAFTMLCADETPMVRRAAAHKMRDFVSVCAKQDPGWSAVTGWFYWVKIEI